MREIFVEFISSLFVWCLGYIIHLPILLMRTPTRKGPVIMARMARSEYFTAVENAVLFIRC
jgi:hypothetical protein